ncbi:hypothetical protein EC973_001223 [Apophysomyces ossiformis]|uniref:Btz domain-containing protein n=1 Tax=Apophysomyces ossiformis TaxID=679940 RepID=A0A8H7BQ99_9FUNG|nr:hypothetical protein EC973_001223 [Apophysomyces ossiformis]
MSKLLKSRRRGRGIVEEEEDNTLSESEELSSEEYSTSDEEEDEDDEEEDEDEEEDDEDGSEGADGHEKETELQPAKTVQTATSEHRTSKAVAEVQEAVEVIDYQTQKKVVYTRPPVVNENKRADYKSNDREVHQMEESASKSNLVQEQEIEGTERVEEIDGGHHERRILEQRAYRRKLAEDPSFVPYVGLFWGHDDRFREDALRPTEDSPHTPSRKPAFAPPTNNRLADRRHSGRQAVDYDALLSQKWTHDGYEELMRLEQEEEQRKRQNLERRDLQRARGERTERNERNRPRRNNKVAPDAGASRWQQFSGKNQTSNEWPDLQEAAGKPKNKEKQKGVKVKADTATKLEDREATTTERVAAAKESAEALSVPKDTVEDVDAKPGTEWTGSEAPANDTNIKKNGSLEESTPEGWGSPAKQVSAEHGWTTSIVASNDMDRVQDQKPTDEGWGTPEVSATNDNWTSSTVEPSNGWQTSFETPVRTSWGEPAKDKNNWNDVQDNWKSKEQYQEHKKPLHRKGYLSKKSLRTTNETWKDVSLQKPKQYAGKQSAMSDDAKQVESSLESKSVPESDGWGQAPSKWTDDAAATAEMASLPNGEVPWITDQAEQTQNVSEVVNDGWGSPAPNVAENAWSASAPWDDTEADKEIDRQQKASQKKVEADNWRKVDKTEDATKSWTSWNASSTTPKRTRGYLSQKQPKKEQPMAAPKEEPDTVNREGAQKTETIAVANEENVASTDKSKVTDERVADREGRDEESDVEIILEAEAESSWGSSEQILGIPTPPPGAEKDSAKDETWEGYGSNRDYRNKGKHRDRFNDRPTASWDSGSPVQGSSDFRAKAADKPTSVESPAASANSTYLAHQGLQPGPYMYQPPMMANPNGGPNIAYIPMTNNGTTAIPMYPIPFQPMTMGPNAAMPNSSPSEDGTSYYQSASVPFNATAGQSAAGYEANGMVYYGMNPSAIYPYYYYSAMPMQGSPGLMMQQGAMNPYNNYMEESEEPADGWGSEPDETVNDSGWKVEGSPSARHGTSKKSSSKGMNYNAPHYYSSSSYPS